MSNLGLGIGGTVDNFIFAVASALIFGKGVIVVNFCFSWGNF